MSDTHKNHIEKAHLLLAKLLYCRNEDNEIRLASAKQTNNPARFFSRKASFKFGNRPGIIFHTPKHYMLGVPESSEYP